jgi:hypothetical protein
MDEATGLEIKFHETLSTASKVISGAHRQHGNLINLTFLFKEIRTERRIPEK